MATHLQAAGAPSPTIVFETLNAFQRTEALRAAIELDLFRFIGKGPGDAASLAQSCSASERGIRILCDFLTINGLLIKQDDRYRHTPSSAMFLDPASPACLSSITRFVCSPALTEPYTHLADIVRHGQAPGEGTVAPDNPIWVDFAHAMAPMMAPLSAPLAAMVLEGRSGPMQVLDIAVGHGLFGIAIAKQAPQAHVVAVDWAAVLEVAKSNAHQAGVADRYRTLAGSAFTVDFGGPYEIVLITNFLHHFDLATCVELLKKVHNATKPGGRVAVLEFVPNEDRISPPVAAAFSLAMLASTPSGDAYTFSELETMLHAAGFANVTQRPVPMGPHTVVMGSA
ncbi:MAG TPA: class I SAM-dependent methyltransferase [Bryobacteraceae bacterium]|nr:class I SAM-dependent methyltransferase [Bryobacteraceae bacterium]